MTPRIDDYALVPKDGPPRLIRYVWEADFLAKYDPKKNLLILNQQQFDTLSREQQEMVLRTHEREIVLGTEHAKLILDQLDMFRQAGEASKAA
ncbi:MAG: hypothetical protein ACXVCO_12530 [Ktedonobacterales bacterium]